MDADTLLWLGVAFKGGVVIGILLAMGAWRAHQK
jgi:hypothetical protein